MKRNPRGPNSQAAIDERRGHNFCCVCDEPMGHQRNNLRKFTCGGDDCRKEWVRILSLDRTWRKQQATMNRQLVAATVKLQKRVTGLFDLLEVRANAPDDR